MSTERPSFGFNSIIPTNYKSKAEAFARCLQDKLRLLGCSDEPSENGHNHISVDTPVTAHESLSKYSEQEIADNVFLQGPLSYKRRSIPENGNRPYTNGNSRSKYTVSSVVDRRGLSSDSEDSDGDDVAATIEHPRVSESQSTGRARLASANSVDSTSSWCSCDDGENMEDEDAIIDSLASQVKGSPKISNPRLRNFKRKGRDDNKALKLERQISQPENDLFFDFDMECFSPVNLDENELDPMEFDLVTQEQTCVQGAVDTGQNTLQTVPDVLTPPPSPVQALSSFDHLEIQAIDNVDRMKLSEPECDSDNEEGMSDLSEAQTIGVDFDEEDAATADDALSLTLSEEAIEICATDDNSCAEICMSDETYESLDACEEVKEFNVPIENPDVLNNDIILETCIADEKSHNVAFSNELNVKDVSCDEVVPDIIEESTECDIKLTTAPSIPIPGNTKGEEEEEIKPKQETEDEKPVRCSVVVTGCDDVEIDESYLPPPRMKLRRCSSLKTWKTPPGTPGRKKIVRFADALGLDLADIRTFLDEIPKIPNSAYEDLHYELPAVAPPLPSAERTLIPMFQQPNTSMEFLQRIRQSNVSLESAILTDASLLAISGIIRVRNLSFHKTVHIRYTKDSWATYSDLQATYVPNSSEGGCDNFSFTLYGHTLSIGDRLEFAIRYDCGNGQFWDSNGGANYCFQCMPRSPATFFPPLGSSPIETWTKFY